MLALALFLVLTAGLLVRLRHATGRHSSDLGSMSREWVHAHNAAAPTWFR